MRRYLLLWTMLATSAVALSLSVAACAVAGEKPRIQLVHHDQQGRLQILVDGREALVYRFGDDVDLPHYFPVHSPAGKLLTIEKTEPYPHHRSFWLGDLVALEGGRKVNFYAALYTQVDPKDPKSPFRDHVRHVAFLPERVDGDRAELGMKLVWEMDGDVPVLDEQRAMRVAALGDGEYLLDVTFTVTASYGDVQFCSDAVHYAWPYLRMHPQFSVDRGGTMTNSEGGVNQSQTHGKPARWIDYSGTVDGVTEGLAVFGPPAEGDPPSRWLTRDYGTFGPRRADARSGRPFTLEKGQSLVRRVGVLVHRGDVTGGKVAQRYRQFVEGKL